jgi:SAM-dependent methyltransferase
MDQERMRQFQLRIFGELSTALAGLLVHVGDRAGLFTALRGQVPMTAAELAAKTGLHERYVREWLSAMAAREIVDYDPGSDRFALPKEHAAVLADEDSPVFTAGWFHALPGFYATAPPLLRAFREGGGVPLAALGDDVVEAVSRARRVVFRHHLVSAWLDAAPHLRERLEHGIVVADLGCGAGHAAIVLARTFPASRFVGFDTDERSIAMAVQHARAAGVAERVEFRRRALEEIDERAAFDLALLFDCIHDLARPEPALRNARASLRAGGSALIQELNVGESLKDNLNPFGAFFYTLSTLHCLTQSLAAGGPGHGTAMPPSTLRDLVLGAGFATLDRLPLDHPLYALYEART